MTPLTNTFEDQSQFQTEFKAENTRKTALFGVPAGRPEVLISVHDEIEPLKAVWQALENSGDGTPFQTYAWVSAWQRHIGTKQGVKPAIVVGWDNEGGALFILPLGIENGVICHKLSWLGGDLSDYNGPLLSRDFPRYVSPAQFPALWNEIRDTLPTHHIVTLSRMPQRIGEQANPMMTLGGLRQNASSAHMTMLKDDWATYYGEKRSSGSKKRDKQKRRKTEELGAVSLVTPESAEEKLRSLDILMEQKAITFARMGVPNLFDKPGYRDFYRDISTSEEAEGLIEVNHLAVGDTVAAAAWGLNYGGRYHYVLASYDEKAEASRFGPGMILLMELMGRATETGKTAFDFTIGDEGYKDQWCEVEIQLFDLVEPNNLVGWLGLGPRIAYLEAKRFIKQTPILWQGFTRLRAATGVFTAALTARA
ncbi:GNAT family N-acetyltransferase [Parvibaculum sp.]|jgi:CelD/BcsL family acetyltransferase involved in cellulose biosynthesis|uniref:GNAT family N-acetyltransferase n=1 Tax=Parvibaculum sp. TaxID=2024848 RepID=UPI000C484C7F|nr:GNAT family N-acetyltransferase [Parvibaculum sp.]MAM93697.1 hypothetical protein [Parvibaculum sp.]HCX67711.1 hypothetical protein [Rhodobiaceae bacterium]|tara:strand:+ start:1119 stop:2387 length:1269 start_codon:yes stop_codon:yes gene_type:complete